MPRSSTSSLTARGDSSCPEWKGRTYLRLASSRSMRWLPDERVMRKPWDSRSYTARRAEMQRRRILDRYGDRRKAWGRRNRRQGFPVCLHVFQVELDCIPDVRQCLLVRLALCLATLQGWAISRVPCPIAFNDYRELQRRQHAGLVRHPQ